MQGGSLNQQSNWGNQGSSGGGNWGNQNQSGGYNQGGFNNQGVSSMGNQGAGGGSGNWSSNQNNWGSSQGGMGNQGGNQGMKTCYKERFTIKPKYILVSVNYLTETKHYEELSTCIKCIIFCNVWLLGATGSVHFSLSLHHGFVSL